MIRHLKLGLLKPHGRKEIVLGVGTLRFDFFCLEAAQITYMNDLTPRVTKLRVYRLSRLFSHILRLFAANLAS